MTYRQKAANRFGAGLIKLMLTAAILSIATTTSYAQDLFPEIKPQPEYEPDEVVGIQMRALGNNDSPFEGAGIELTFRFASPSNKAMTGPLERFSLLFTNPAYKPMTEYTDLQIGESTVVNGEALVPVVITDANGDKAGYMFALSQQTQAPYENCWMTDRVIRVTLPEGNATVL